MELPDFVTWDRGTIGDEAVIVFGWIARSDGKRDFAIVEINKATGEVEWWATSSAKYSERFHLALGGDLKEHTACVPFKEALAACGLYPVEARP